MEDEVMDIGSTVTNYLGLALDSVVKYAPTILIALVILWIGMRIIKAIVKLADKGMASRDLDISLRGFLGNLLSWVLKIALFLAVIGYLGFQTTSLLALFGAAGLAVGLALQGSLSNFAGGVLLMIFRPFKIGDKITSQGHTGDVEDIQIFATKLVTADNKTVILPNGALMNGDIVNITEKGVIRVDLSVGIGYGEDINKAKNAISAAMAAHPLVLKDPAPGIGVSELADSSVNIAVMPYCDPANYWTVYFDILQHTKEALDKAGVEIPFPQVDVNSK